MKNIFFVDADDTILDFHGASAKALQFAFEQSGLRWSEGYLADFRRINGGLWEALERKELTREELMQSRFHIFLDAMGFHDTDGNEFNKCFLGHLSTNPLYLEGAQAFLEKLRALGRVYIVTNGTAWIQKSRFDISNLWSYAEDTFVSDLIGHDKPAKEYTDFVIAHIPDFSKENAVWIGDSLSADIKAAKEAGITSLWFNPHKKQATGIAPDYEAATFDEALALIGQM